MGLFLFETLLLLLFFGFAGYLFGYWVRKLIKPSHSKKISTGESSKVKKSKSDNKFKYRYLKSDNALQVAPDSAAIIDKTKAHEDIASDSVTHKQAFHYRYLKDDKANITKTASNESKSTSTEPQAAMSSQDVETTKAIEISEVKRISDKKFKYRYLKDDMVKAPEKVTPSKTPSKPKKEAVPDHMLPGNRPQTLVKATDDKPDDLKRISGIGPVLEKVLNEVGIFHFDQIAKWTKDEVEWIDAKIAFHGRIYRERWIEQAKILEKGEETDFSKRYDHHDKK